MPTEINKALEKANRGELEFKVKDVTNSAKLLYSLGHQVLYGLFSMVSGGMAYFSYLRDDNNLTNWFSGVSAFFVFSLLVSMWRVKKRLKKEF